MKIRSLKQKLSLRYSATLALVLFSFLGFYSWHLNQTTDKRIEKIRQTGLKNLINSGRLAIQDKAISFKTYVRDVAYTDIQQILAENVDSNQDFVLGGYVRESSYDIRAWATPDNPTGNPFQAGTIELADALKGLVDFSSGIPVMRNELTIWSLDQTKRGERKAEIDGKDFYEFATPISVSKIEEDEDGNEYEVEVKTGAVFFRLSTENMEQSIDEERAAYQLDQKKTLGLMMAIGMLVLGLGIILTRRQASTITQPLAVLTSAAESISRGNLGIAVEVSSGDEIETLGNAFNQMTKDLGKSYADLQMRNQQLEDARCELEDLNRTLEKKVEERTKQLAESESKFRTLFEESADAILLGSEDSFLDCNPSMLQIMGCKNKPELLSMHLNDISPEYQPNQVCSSDKLHQFFRLARSEGSRQFEWVNRRVDGTEFHTEIVITSFPLSGKQVLHMVFRDISERKRTEAALKNAQAQLVETAHSAGMAEIATGVLHNIGNILNSVNISTEEIGHTLKMSKLKGLLKANDLLKRNMNKISYFLTEHPKGKLIPGYFLSLGEAIKEEQQLMAGEIKSLGEKVSMMRDVISTQQNYAKATLFTEDIVVSDLVEDAIKLQMASLRKQGVMVRKDFRAHPRGMVSKIKLVHVLTNLIKNGKEAMSANELANIPQEMVIRIEEPESNKVQIHIEDNGCGIMSSHLEKIFNHGFTTKEDGHGFGLHTCANFMTEMGGSLVAGSEGESKGSTFTLTFPLMQSNRSEMIAIH